MGILEKAEINNNIYSYYINNFGEKETDKWYQVTAVNVWAFRRDNKIITLKCHILTGKITEYIETI